MVGRVTRPRDSHLGFLLLLLIASLWTVPVEAQEPPPSEQPAETERSQRAVTETEPSTSEVPSETSAETREPFAAPFGTRGQWLITESSSIGISSSSFDGSQASRFSATFSPGVDYFFVRNVSVGLDLGFAYGDAKGYGADGSLVDTRSTTLSGGVRLGWNLPLGRRFSWYPRLTVGFESIHHEQSLVMGNTISVVNSPLGYPATTETGPWINANLPLLLHVAPHFFFGAGPRFFAEFGHAQGGPDVGGQRISAGFGVDVGGTFGGAPSSFEDSVAERRPPEPPIRGRFGQSNEFVFDGEVSADISYTAYLGTNSSGLGVAFEPSFDYFVDDHVSLGVAPALSYSSASGIDPITQARVETTVTGWGIEPRIGFDLPLSSHLSWYLRIGFVFGGQNWDEKSAGQANTYSTSLVAFHAFAPLLIHPAPHLFAGFGPAAYAELSNQYSYGPDRSQQNRQTTVGASLVVGGWI
jgi:hypothetical protein